MCLFGKSLWLFSYWWLFVLNFTYILNSNIVSIDLKLWHSFVTSAYQSSGEEFQELWEVFWLDIHNLEQTLLSPTHLLAIGPTRCRIRNSPNTKIPLLFLLLTAGTSRNFCDFFRGFNETDCVVPIVRGRGSDFCRKSAKRVHQSWCRNNYFFPFGRAHALNPKLKGQACSREKAKVHANTEELANLLPTRDPPSQFALPHSSRCRKPLLHCGYFLELATFPTSLGK